MNIQIHRLDPNVPDPVESRRSTAGRLVRLIYGLCVLGILGFFAVYFGASLILLKGPGIVSASREIVSLPYIVQVMRMEVKPGEHVQSGSLIARVRSPQVNETLSNLTRALADVTSREAELRVKARIARDSLASAKSRLRNAEDTAARLEANPNPESASLVYRADVYRERAQAVQNVVALEAETEESSAQLGRLAETHAQIQGQLDEVQKDFDKGRVFAPAEGIVSTRLTRAGETVLAGTALAEIFQPENVYVDWYIPNFRFADPQPGHRVFVVLGKTRTMGTITEILPISETFEPGRNSILREPQTGQIARVRLDADAHPPALNATVSVHMYYTGLADSIARAVVRFLGLN